MAGRRPFEWELAKEQPLRWLWFKEKDARDGAVEGATYGDRGRCYGDREFARVERIIWPGTEPCHAEMGLHDADVDKSFAPITFLAATRYEPGWVSWERRLFIAAPYVEGGRWTALRGEARAKAARVVGDAPNRRERW